MPDTAHCSHHMSVAEFRHLVRSFQGDALTLFTDDCYVDWIVSRRFMHFSLHLFNHPEAVHDILVRRPQEFPKSSLVNTLLGTALGRGLVTSEGPYWRRNRNIVQPAFDHRNLDEYASIMSHKTIDLCDKWAADSLTSIDAQREMMQLTLGIICDAMFSTDASALVELVDSSSRLYQKQMTFSPLGVIPGVRKLWAMHAYRKGKGIIRELDQAIYSLVKDRRSLPPKKDLLNDLMTATNPDDLAGLSVTEVRDQVITIFMAGHETSALSLAWCLQLLANHPIAQETLVNEIDTQLGQQPLTLGNMNMLPYTRAVIDETLRLYPAIHTLGWREAAGDTTVGGIPVKKGAIILVSPWVLHRHKKLWIEPDKFLPERFLNSPLKGDAKMSYIPFSMGPRVCVAKNFALVEMMLILVQLIRRFRFSSEGPLVPPKAMITLLPSAPIALAIAPR